MPGATSAECSEGQDAGTPTILLVEDNEDSLLTVADYFAFKGLHVVVVRSGSEALAFCRAALPALILMDIQMQGMSGLAAIERLRPQPATATTPIIAVTALALH